jgi:glutamate synthase (NADPH/NADH) small chain
MWRFDRKQKLTNKGIETKGVVQAMTFLTQQTKSLYVSISDQIKATMKDVIVIGGGDTGSGVWELQIDKEAKSVTNFEIMPKPPVGRSETTPWPFWPLQLKHPHLMRKVAKNWLINTKEFISNDKGELVGLKTVEVDWMTPRTKTRISRERRIRENLAYDLALCTGFTGPKNPKQSIRIRT